MSNNPWPFVLAYLALLGFPANSIAQQSGHAPSDSEPATATFNFGDLRFDEPEIPKADTEGRYGDRGFRVSDDNRREHNPQPLGQGSARAQSGSDISALLPGQREFPGRTGDVPASTEPKGKLTGGIKEDWHDDPSRYLNRSVRREIGRAHV
jgi:hypothetical protein